MCVGSSSNVVSLLPPGYRSFTDGCIKAHTHSSSLSFLQEFFNTVTIFLRLEKIQFGGVKGQSLSDLVEAMFQEFNDLMNAFMSKPEDPLDISNNVCSAWCCVPECVKLS
jgi:hypothetical protein